MSVDLDRRYIDRISPSLDRFEWDTSGLRAVCRCPICQDSSKSKTKRRFYFYVSKGSSFDGFMCKCHNCSWSGSLRSLIKSSFGHLEQDYTIESVSERYMDAPRITSAPMSIESNPKSPPLGFRAGPVDGLPSIPSLPDGHPAKAYLIRRLIPWDMLADIRWAEDFADLAHHMDPTTKGRLQSNDPRIVIPFRDRHGSCFAVQGRTMVPGRLRYITIRDAKSDMPKVYGLDRFNPDADGYVLEGPIDSMFVRNALAMAGSAMRGEVPFDWARMTVVHDNEPRSKEICRLIRRSIDIGRRVFIPPPEMDGCKDINDLVIRERCNGRSFDATEFIRANSFAGPEAKLRFSAWNES